MAALIAKSERLQKIFNTKKIDVDIKAIAIVSGMMNLEEKTIGYWGVRSMVLKETIRNKNITKI